MGTFQYMRRRSCRVQESDARSDIFALGVVLYEMATGRHAFEGKTTASVIAAILEKILPPISQTKPVAPAALDYCVRTCLAKDPEDRYQTAHDVKTAIGLGTASLGSRQIKRQRQDVVFPPLASWIRRSSRLDRARRSSLMEPVAGDVCLAQPSILPPEIQTFSSLEISARRRHSRRTEIYGFGARIRRTGSGTVAAPAEPENGEPGGRNGCGFVSLSGRRIARSIGFFADGKLKRIAVSGGSAMTLADAVNGRGGAWSSKGVILFTPDFRGPLMQVSERRRPDPATQVDLAFHTTHRWPFFFRDEKHFVFLANNHTGGDPSHNGIYIGALGDT